MGLLTGLETSYLQCRTRVHPGIVNRGRAEDRYIYSIALAKTDILGVASQNNKFLLVHSGPSTDTVYLNRI